MASTAIPRVVVHAHGTDVTFEDLDLDESEDARGIRSFLRSGHFYEAAFLDYIRSLGREGAYVDVGGFIGTHALYFAMLCPSDHVYTFEPRPRPRGELERNVAANGQQRKVTVSRLGLGDARRTAVAQVEGEQITFECVPMDDVVERPVAVIKIDVEGMEVEVLRGAQRILERFHPVVFAEAHTHQHREAIGDCLARHGYVRTGRVFNASPTYEYVHVPETGVAEDLRRAYADLRRAYADTARAGEAAKKALSTAQYKYREATAHEKATSLQLRAAETEVRRLRGELQKLEPRLREQVRGEEQKKAQDTLSFQLGQAFIKATKSPRGLIALPRALFALRRRRKRLVDGPMHDAPVDPAELITVRVRSERRFSPPEILTRTDLAPTERLARLRVAGIMDQLTTTFFEPECSLFHVRPSTWNSELPKFAPELLFVASTQATVPELGAVIDWCRTAGIPTVFWSTEDPVHFAELSNTASLFDFVFTTDLDGIRRYKELLGHDRVYLLPFAAQPSIHNPIEHRDRKDAVCMFRADDAPELEPQPDFLDIVTQLESRWSVERPAEESDRDYKGYRYALKPSSVKYSQTAFTRGVFELVASNTVVISNFSRSARLLLGDLVIASDDPSQLAVRLDDISRTPSRLHGFRLAALRKVLAEHTYQDRLADVVARVFRIEPLSLLPEVTVLGVARTTDDAAAIRAAFARQDYPHRRLLLLAEVAGSDRLANHIDPFGRVAVFVPSDYYGPSYLSDLVLATRYWRGAGVGKVAHHVWRDGAITLIDGGQEYRRTSTLPARRALVSPAVLGDVPTNAFAAGVENLTFGGDFLAIDELGYCCDGARAPVATVAMTVDGVVDLDPGLGLQRLLAAAESIPGPQPDDVRRTLGPAGLAGLFKAKQVDEIETTHDDGLRVASSLRDGAHQYIYGAAPFQLSSLGFSDAGKVFFDVTSGLEIKLVLLFLDAEGERLDPQILMPLTDHQVQIPSGAVSVRLGFRVAGAGVATVRAVVFGSATPSEPTFVFGRHELLVLTNIYPARDNLYRNAFVHRRVMEYARQGKRVDVFCLRPASPIASYEFEGVDVVRGGKHVLQSLLATKQHRTILVHFLDHVMWDLLEPHLDRLKLIVWIHGAEIQPWHRRSFNYTTPEELESAKKSSAVRVDLWNRVLQLRSPNLHLITVSRTLANEIEEDYGVQLIPSQHSVIHNVIDTELFRYEPKPASQRTKILSIRPFASRTYANDLTVAAILELAKRPWFGDLDFHLIGDGPLFDETVAPLRGLRNVLVERRFVRQDEIAALHRRHGVFLCPTRMDSQGVSRDEAMSSGLVPITTHIAAVPEFVDVTCGFLARPENATDLAAAIEILYHEPSRFERMSAAAAARVRRQSGPEQTTARELALI